MKKYGLVAGAWGDIICGLKEVKENNFRSIYLMTAVNDVSNFLLAQDFIDEIIEIPWDNHLFGLLYGRHISNKDLRIYLKSESEIINCTNMSLINAVRVDLVDNLKVDEKSMNWAKKHLSELPAEFILFQPYSTNNSAPLSVHWPHWKKLLKYLLEKNNNVVCCGINNYFFEFDKYDNFYDFTNATSSLQEIFALSLYAERTFTTHNGFSFFCSSHNLKSVVIFNNHANNIYNSFNRGINNSNLLKIDYNTDFFEAISLIESFKERTNTVHQLLTEFPYLFYKNIPDIIKYNKNTPSSIFVSDNDIKSIYTNTFNYYLFCLMILKNKNFTYHCSKIEDDRMNENIKYFENKYKIKIDFRVAIGKIEEYDFTLDV
jgi:hypothetical protein